jgi:hypothetical protein
MDGMQRKRGPDISQKRMVGSVHLETEFKEDVSVNGMDGMQRKRDRYFQQRELGSMFKEDVSVNGMDGMRRRD